MKNIINIATKSFIKSAIVAGTRTISEKIILFARGNIGNRVFASDIDGAKGECWDLAYEALNIAGAKTPYDYKGSLYYWSSKKVTLGNALPGDIIQYKNYKGKTKITKEDGSWYEETYEIGAPHHTAILKAKLSNGQVEVYEQNMDYIKTVQINTYYLKPGTYSSLSETIKMSKVRGSFTIYRPLLKVKKSAFLTPSSYRSPLRYASVQQKRQLHSFPNIIT